VAPFILDHHDYCSQTLIGINTHGKRPRAKQPLMHPGQCCQWRTQGELANGGSRTSISYVNVNIEALDSQHCQTGALLIICSLLLLLFCYYCYCYMC